MLPKKVKIFITLIVIMLVGIISYVKIVTWYPDFTRKVKSLDKLKSNIVYIDEIEDITNLENYELLQSRSLFSKAIGYLQNFNYKKDSITYSISINSNYGDSSFTSNTKEIYREINIYSNYYDGEQGLTFTYSVFAVIDNYLYEVSCNIEKNAFNDKTIAIKNAKEITYKFMYDLIDQKFK